MTSTVTATFVFTDLVDSTATAARLGPDGAEELRQTHFRLLRGAIAGSGGTEVKNLGDGLMVMYSSPSRALSGACPVDHRGLRTICVGLIGLSDDVSGRVDSRLSVRYLRSCCRAGSLVGEAVDGPKRTRSVR